jgi:hypothetical protein
VKNCSESPNHALSPSHSVVTALAQDGKRRAEPRGDSCAATSIPAFTQ